MVPQMSYKIAQTMQSTLIQKQCLVINVLFKSCYFSPLWHRLTGRAVSTHTDSTSSTSSHFMIYHTQFSVINWTLKMLLPSFLLFTVFPPPQPNPMEIFLALYIYIATPFLVEKSLWLAFLFSQFFFHLSCHLFLHFFSGSFSFCL